MKRGGLGRLETGGAWLVLTVLYSRTRGLELKVLA